MSYITDRDAEQLAQLNAQISLFINRYRQHRPARRKTVILFPGGMGSGILRASAPQGVTPYVYDTTWIDCSILLGAALLMKMNRQEDEARHFVIANGCVEFGLANLRPYNDFLEWCTLNKFDWFAFGWDWRRPPQEIADFFVKQFMPLFKKRVKEECGANPFNDLTLVGHSFGGMIVKLVLHGSGDTVAAIRRAITVASPFYGYAGQLNRYFKGDPDLDKLSLSYNERNLVQLISSLWGPYGLLYLDEATYQRDKAALAADTRFPLTRYPLRDRDTDGVADAYNPTQLDGKVRYPQNWGFSTDALEAGRITYQKVAKPLPASSRQKLFHIRGVQTRNGANIYETIHEQSWGWIRPDFDPKRGTSPVKDRTVCPGDGVIPAWSARLVSTPAANVRTVFGDADREGFEHMDLMLNRRIQAQIFDIMQ